MVDTSEKYAPGMHPNLPPPGSRVGALAWLYNNLLSTPTNILLTLVSAFLVYVTVPPFLNWAFFDADWIGETREACSREGACWIYIKIWFKQLMYFRYPSEELWRVNDTYIVLVAALMTLMLPREPNQRWRFFFPLGMVIALSSLIGLMYALGGSQGDETNGGASAGWIIAVGALVAFALPVLSRVRRVNGFIGGALAVAYALIGWNAFLGDGFGTSFVIAGSPFWAWVLTLVMVSLGYASYRIVTVPTSKAKGWIGLFLLVGFPIIAFALYSGGSFTFNLLKWIPFVALVVAWLPLFMPQFQGKSWLGRYRGIVQAATIVVFLWLLFSPFHVDHRVDASYPLVETPLWGGLFLTLVIALTGIVASLPLGILLALGRRSDMPVVKAICVAFIELWRGVPLITVLFMSSVMFPLFMPEGVNFDKLIRALLGVMLFSAAYMAEVVRGGLQAIPKGQYEAAEALGLSYWKMMGLIILPQALKIVIPGIVNTFIGLFKDTVLVLVIGLFDFLGAAQAVSTNPDWLGFAVEGYVFVGFGFWVFCFGMSRYSQHLERKLHTGH